MKDIYDAYRRMVREGKDEKEIAKILGFGNVFELRRAYAYAKASVE